MALELSVTADAFLQQNNITGNIILELEGFPALYGSVKVTRLARYGDPIFFGDSGLVYGGAVSDNQSKDYISLTGTTNNITQKLDQDKGGSSSVTSFKIRLVDKDNELTQAFSPGITVTDILGNEATVYWQPVGSKHPVDSARLFVGIVSSASFGAGYVDLTIQHPSTLSRQELLPKITGSLTANLNAGVTACLVDTTAGVVSPQENLETYIRINDEIIKIQGITSSGFLSMTRGQFGTIDANHSSGDEYETFYRLQGDPIELSLRMLLSNPDSQNFATKTASRIVQVDATTSVAGAVFFDGIDVQDELGLVVGDQLSITVGADVSNLIGYTNILSFGTNSSGSWCVVDATLTPEIDISATVLFKSKYNKLSFGAGANIKPYHVDVAQFESLDTTFSAQFFDYDYYIKDTINLKEFLENSLYYPSGLFSLPRQGRISLGISAPPILGPNAKTLSADNITNAERVAITRSINEAFYNSVAYKFNEDAVEDRFLSGTIFSSEDSFNRINVGNRTLTIEAGGIRESAANRNKIDSISRRFLDRYQFGAEQVVCNVNFKTAFSVEPGDTVVLDGESIQLADITQGNRNFLPRVCEVVNRAINLKTGACTLTISDTNLSTRTRYCVFSPSSIIGTGSTTTELVITRSYSTGPLELERDKWTDYLLQKVRIHNSDYSYDEETTLIALSASNPNIVQVNPPLPSAPTSGFILTVPEYDETSKQDMKLYKALHGFWNPQVAATGGSTTTFTVASGDASKFYVGASVRIHLADYSEDDTTTVAEISGTTITLNKTLAFSVTSSHLVDNIGFAGDQGSYYAFY